MSGKTHSIIKSETNDVVMVAEFSECGKYLVTASRDGRARL